LPIVTTSTIMDAEVSASLISIIAMLTIA
jgi:hypothetical protein